MDTKEFYTLPEVLKYLGLSSPWQLYRSGLIHELRRFGRNRYDPVSVHELGALLARRRAWIVCGRLPKNFPLRRAIELTDDSYDIECPHCGGQASLCPPSTDAEIHRYTDFLLGKTDSYPAACGWCGWKGEIHS